MARRQAGWRRPLPILFLLLCLEQATRTTPAPATQARFCALPHGKIRKDSTAYTMPGWSRRAIGDRTIVQRGGRDMSIADRGPKFEEYVRENLQKIDVFPEEARQIAEQKCDYLLFYPQLGQKCDKSFDFGHTEDLVRLRYLGLLTTILDPACLDVSLLSDGKPDAKEAVQIQNFVRQRGMQLRRPDTSSLSEEGHTVLLQAIRGGSGGRTTRFEFDVMRLASSTVGAFVPRALLSLNGFGNVMLMKVHADILIAATSGFSRLAAMLNNHTRMAPELESHPLHNFAGLVNVQPLPDFWDLNTYENAVASDSLNDYVAAISSQLQEQDYVSHLRAILMQRLPAAVMRRCLQPSSPTSSRNIHDASSKSENPAHDKHTLVNQIRAVLNSHGHGDNSKAVQQLERLANISDN
ncbi:uncharacterized protein MONBRDRAFT_23047 [Monosiga brevicollis MX1]|uniref:Uncharacterized protein n=1 Tax=Monosiga brevicollis TaxID=81824 RepID=A9USV0_MONBE|nr:uncharacterized protein MONBRDRAFT_23047 [Monosiga brevicollis MX1]EDQ92168.1 predicted protein [Monosiga brevicollis MX1]|eukprot:XP_001743454.1 hypothetical protein [Monosiga brevicollis MX1]